MKPYEWMVAFTPQREWIAGRGILLWLAFFFLELGAGLYLMALILGSAWGYITGWLVTIVLGGGCHLLYLGRPWRFWRIAFRPQASWISRGMIFLLLYIVLGALHLSQAFGLLRMEPAVPTWLMGGVSFLLIVYGAFAMNYLIAIPFWNTAILPVLYLVSGLWGGAELALGIDLLSGNASLIEPVEVWIRGLLLGYILVVAVYLLSAQYAAPAARHAVRELLHGGISALFYGGVLALGVIVPAIIAAYGFLAGREAVAPALLLAGIACQSLGDLSLRYCILKCGFYQPLVTTSAIER